MTRSAARKLGPVARLVEATPLRRRLVTIPVYGLAWLATTGLAPLWLPVATLVGVWRRQSFMILRLLLFLWVYLSLALVTLAAYLALYLGDRERRDERLFSVSGSYGNALFSWCVRLLSLSVAVEGDKSSLRGPLLVLVRHASIVDAALPAWLLSTNGLRLRYILRKELMMEPCLDIAGHAGPHCFLDRDGDAHQELSRIREVAQHLGSHAVVIYPEGTRFSVAKRDKAIQSLERDRPELATIAASMTHVLPPKVGGVLQLLKTAPGADCVIVAHRGLEGFASPRHFFRGSAVGRRIEVRIWRVRRENVPPVAEQPRWLFDLWRGVGDFVAGPQTTRGGRAPPPD